MAMHIVDRLRKHQDNRQLDYAGFTEDRRMRTAKEFLSQNRHGIFLLHKTTRAGATTGMCANLLNRHENFVIVVPTNKIATGTVLDESLKYANRDDVRTTQIKNNKHCIKIQELCNKYPDLNHLPIIPLPEKCTDCNEYERCPVTEYARGGHYDGVAITYAKLGALMLSRYNQGSVPQVILNKVLRARTIIFDEVHEIQHDNADTLEIYKDGEHFNFARFQGVAEYNYVFDMLYDFVNMYNSPAFQNGMQELVHGANDNDYWRKHLSITLENRYSKKYRSHKTVMAVYSEIVELMKHKKNVGLTVSDILQLYKILNVVSNHRTVLNAIRATSGDVVISISPVDELMTRMTQEFIRLAERLVPRMIFTSATICQFDVSSLFEKSEVKNVAFSHDGDPMGSNSKMLVLADKTKLGQIETWKNLDSILEQVTRILDAYGTENVFIVTINTRSAVSIKKELKELGYEDAYVTYYKADDTMGVKSDKRVMIAIGMAYKPINSYDPVTRNRTESDAVYEEALHADTWQTWSRVKDPSGKQPSLVFAIGCKEDDVQNTISWGFGRRVEVMTDGNKKIKRVYIDNPCISRPKVVHCNSFIEMAKHAEKHTNVKIDVEGDKKDRNLIRFLISDKYSVRRVTATPLTLNKYLVSRWDVHAEQVRMGKNVGSYVRVGYGLTDELIEKHLAGEATFGTYQLTVDNTVRWICFDIDAHPKDDMGHLELYELQEKAEDDKDRMTAFFDMYGIPYILEASGTPHSYHIWVLLAEVDAAKAKAFGTEIKKELDIKCELYPKQARREYKGYGNLVKLPFAWHVGAQEWSKILVDGEWVSNSEIQSFEIGILDITMFEPSKKRQWARMQAQSQVRIQGIRPCIQSALGKQLSGSEGHWMRIAIVREFYNAGMKNINDLIKLFSKQSDFDPETSRSKIESIICKEMPNVRRWKLLEECPSYLNCQNCNRIDCKTRG